MAFSQIQSVQVTGLGATEVTVEVDITRGLPLFQIVGLPNKSVAESKERVISALHNSGVKNIYHEQKKIIVALSPAELKKEGAYVDMAIALGYLLASATIAPASLQQLAQSIFVGELSLNGSVRAVRGILSIIAWAKKCNVQRIYIPQENYNEALLCADDAITIFLVSTLADLIDHVQGKESGVTVLQKESSVLMTHNVDGTKITQNKQCAEFIRSAAFTQSAVFTKNTKEDTSEKDYDAFSAIKGHDQAKRALIIAAAGRHAIFLWGPPGTGKTMLAKGFRYILPDLTDEEFLEVATIYSSIGKTQEALLRRPPFRTPHHSASHTAMIGGGSTIHPGEITLAHRGVLYMDEFLEFDRRTIEALRQPLEDNTISIQRSGQSVTFPADVILLATANPCPCGYRGSIVRHCSCSGQEIARYHKKLSGPIVDRIDMWIPVHHISYETFYEEKNKVSLHSESEPFEVGHIRKEITRVQELQKKRHLSLRAKNMQAHDLGAGHVKNEYGQTSRSGKYLENSADETSLLFSQTEKDALQQLQESATLLKLSPRSYLRVIKVARTIADISESEMIQLPHILEALQYRARIE